MANKTSPHILNTSANLLGFCLIVITSIHVVRGSSNTLIDEFTSIVALQLAFSCILSFVAIRTQNERREKLLERIADILFFTALAGIIIIVAFLTINYWNKGT